MSKSGFFILFCCVFLAGIWVGITWQVSVWILLALLAIFCILLYWLKFVSGKLTLNIDFGFWKNWLIIFCALACSFLFGALRAQFSYHQNQFADFINQKIILNAYICSDPLPAANNTQSFEICFTSKYSQKIEITSFSRDNYFYGNNLEVVGKVKIPLASGDFDYASYLKTKNVYAQIYGPQTFITGASIHNPIIYAALKFKHFLFNRFYKYLSKEKAALLIAIIIGEKSLLGQNIIDAFTIAGLVHIIAVSGFVLTLNLALISELKQYIGKNKTLLLCAAVALLYLIMSDFAAGFMRAAIMGGIYAFGKVFGRQYQLMPSLTLTAAILVFINPLILKYDTGFIFSFVSIVGIIYFTPILNHIFKFIPKTFGIRNILTVTLAAQIITIPISAYYFQRFSLVSPLTNLFIFPAFEFCLFAAYWLCLPLAGYLAAQFLSIALNYILVIASSVSTFKYASLPISINGWQMLLLYALEFGTYLLIYKELKERILFDRL